jgi:trk system potassium uptake protein TrkH
LRRSAAQLTPVYGVLTIALTIGLMLAGEVPLVAVIHAMSTMATSGITPGRWLAGRPAGIVGEAMILLFFVFALSRRTFSRRFDRGWFERHRTGPGGAAGGLRRGACCQRSCSCATGWVRWRSTRSPISRNAIAALWGSAFTVLSFLTTTGFVSESWVAAQDLVGARDAGPSDAGPGADGRRRGDHGGGAEAPRVYALYKHGVREMGKLIYPSSVGGAGRLGRRIRREGAYIAWIFFMLFILTLAAVMLALAATGSVSNRR